MILNTNGVAAFLQYLSQSPRPSDALSLARISLFHLDRTHSLRESQGAQRLADVVGGGSQMYQHQCLRVTTQRVLQAINGTTSKKQWSSNRDLDRAR